jgi:hypothetical protein
LPTPCKRAPDPDRLLVNCDRWLESLGATLTYYRLFAETPHALKPVLAVLGASDYMADTLLQNPELSEILLDVRLLTRPRTRADMRRDLSRLLRACTTYWMQLDRLRAFKQQEYLRITALDLLGKAIAERNDTRPVRPRRCVRRRRAGGVPSRTRRATGRHGRTRLLHPRDGQVGRTRTQLQLRY